LPTEGFPVAAAESEGAGLLFGGGPAAVGVTGSRQSRGLGLPTDLRRWAFFIAAILCAAAGLNCTTGLQDLLLGADSRFWRSGEAASEPAARSASGATVDAFAHAA